MFICLNHTEFNTPGNNCSAQLHWYLLHEWCSKSIPGGYFMNLAIMEFNGEISWWPQTFERWCLSTVITSTKMCDWKLGDFFENAPQIKLCVKGLEATSKWKRLSRSLTLPKNFFGQSYFPPLRGRWGGYSGGGGGGRWEWRRGGVGYCSWDLFVLSAEENGAARRRRHIAVCSAVARRPLVSPRVATAALLVDFDIKSRFRMQEGQRERKLDDVFSLPRPRPLPTGAPNDCVKAGSR